MYKLYKITFTPPFLLMLVIQYTVKNIKATFYVINIMFIYFVYTPYIYNITRCTYFFLLTYLMYIYIVAIHAPGK